MFQTAPCVILDAGGVPLTAPDRLANATLAEPARDPFTPDPPVSPKQLWEWRKQLAEVSPPHAHLSYLYLVWEPGWTWEPVGRWMLFDMKPLESVHPLFVEELKGPDPATLTTRDQITGELTQKTMVTAMQWKLYQETARYGTPWWVIQGSRGGHKVFFSEVEKKLMRLAGYPDNLPAPGELPYAPFDARVIHHIHRHDKLKKADGNVRRMAKMSAGSTGLMQQAMRQQLVGWLGGQVEDAAKEMIQIANANDMPHDRTQLVPETVMDEQTAQFVERGKFSDVSR